jgi:hypothetical protein
MPTTDIYAFRYPALSDPANGPVGFQNLATDVETALDDVQTAVQSGVVDVVFAGTSSHTVSITFPQAFATPPAVVAPAGNSFFNVSNSSITTTGANLSCRHIDANSSTSTVPVHWIAHGTPA